MLTALALATVAGAALSDASGGKKYVHFVLSTVPGDTGILASVVRLTASDLEKLIVLHEKHFIDVSRIRNSWRPADHLQLDVELWGIFDHVLEGILDRKGGEISAFDVEIYEIYVDAAREYARRKATNDKGTPLEPWLMEDEIRDTLSERLENSPLSLPLLLGDISVGEEDVASVLTISAAMYPYGELVTGRKHGSGLASMNRVRPGSYANRVGIRNGIMFRLPNDSFPGARPGVTEPITVARLREALVLLKS